MHRVLICDPLAPEGVTVLEQTGTIDVVQKTGLKGDALRQALAECDGAILRSGTTLTADLFTRPSQLKAVVRAGVGVDNIDVPAATRAGVVVMNTPGGNTLSTAEHTLALLYAMCRQVPAADASLRTGRWERSKFMGAQLAGKTLGIIGLGRIGLAVAKRAIAMEMRVVGFDPFLTAERAAELGIEKVARLEDLFPRVNIVTVHVPISAETLNLIGRDALAALPKGSYVINCARGGIIDESALADALKSGQLAGAALDVFVTEPPTGSPLLGLANVVVTPHLGASTSEAQVSVAVEAAQLLVDYLTTGNVRFAVNMAPIDPAELAEVRRYLDVAYRLGRLQAQVVRGTIRNATVEYRGDAAKKKTSLITAAFAVGLLEHALEETINLVNAPLLAHERGITLTEMTSSETSDFNTLLRTEVVTDRESFVASGTTRGTQYNRLVRLGPYRMDSFLEGTMLLFIHQDQPGLIGLVGTVLGNHGVNIAQMTVGRKQPGGEAIGVLAVDTQPPPAALDELRRDSRVTDLRVVHLPQFGESPAIFG